MDDKKRVTGIGGLFFTSADPASTRAWYAKHLGFKAEEWGAMFPMLKANGEETYTVWSPFKQDTEYFKPGTKDFMVNYQVEDLEWLVEQLRNEGVTICDEIESSEFGKFVHILDPDGNKIELWEP